MCANCDELSDDINSFKVQCCTERKRFPDEGLPLEVPPEPPMPENPKPPSSSDPTTFGAEADAPANGPIKSKLHYELIQAQAHLEQLMLWQSLETERQHLQVLLLQKQQQEQGIASI